MRLKQCYTTLEVNENASTGDIKQAYRDLISIWHPDRHAQNPRLHEKATEKLKELNAAYDMLMSHRSPGDKGGLSTGRRTAKTKVFTGKKTTSKRRPYFIWALVLLALVIGSARVLSKWSGGDFFNRIDSLLNRQEKSSETEESVSGDPWVGIRLDGKYIVELQRSLLLLGYDSGPVDGKMGAKTIGAAQQFSADFRISPGETFIENFIAELSRQASITRTHPDWPEIVKSRDFNTWIENQTISSSEICRKIIASGPLEQVVNLIYGYTFDRIKPSPMALPPSGIMKKRFYRGMAPLKIKTRNEGRHYYIKLVEIPDKEEMFTAFVRSGGMLKVHVPLGTYELKYAVGGNWYGTQWLFGNDTVFSRLNQVFEFKLNENEISGYSVDLYLKPLIVSSTPKDYAFDF